MPDRITSYGPGISTDTRIDEIVLSGKNVRNGGVHVEMLDERHACMWIGERMFSIHTAKGRLFIALREGNPDA